MEKKQRVSLDPETVSVHDLTTGEEVNKPDIAAVALGEMNQATEVEAETSAEPSARIIKLPTFWRGH